MYGRLLHIRFPLNSCLPGPLLCCHKYAACTVFSRAVLLTWNNWLTGRIPISWMIRFRRSISGFGQGGKRGEGTGCREQELCILVQCIQHNPSQDHTQISAKIGFQLLWNVWIESKSLEEDYFMFLPFEVFAAI